MRFCCSLKCVVLNVAAFADVIRSRQVWLRNGKFRLLVRVLADAVVVESPNYAANDLKAYTLRRDLAVSIAVNGEVV